MKSRRLVVAVAVAALLAAAYAKARPPSTGGDQVRYLDTFLEVRVKAMKLGEAHSDTSRVDDAQRVFCAPATST